MAVQSVSLFSEVKNYIKLSRDLQAHLARRPEDYPKFQAIFDASLEKISLDILHFEKNNIAKSEAKVFQFKQIFEKRYRHYFLCGEFPRWVYYKPYGYAGDYKIIDDIYQNKPRTIGFDRLWDNYFQQMMASRATRERKESLKKFILDFVQQHKNKEIRIMNLASGPAREIKELLEGDSSGVMSKVVFDCYDFDVRALDYAKELLNNNKNVNFIQKNAIRIALKKVITDDVPHRYDLIYSAGLLDYLDVRIAVKLVNNLKKILKKNGSIVIANFGDKYNNTSAGIMEWATEWYLIYRPKEELMDIFLTAGFSAGDLNMMAQKDKVVNYCVTNST